MGVAAALALLAGCSAQAGAHLGRTLHGRPELEDRWAWAGRVEGHLPVSVGLDHLRLHVGLESEGRVEESRHGLLTWGPQLGLDLKPWPRVGVIGHFDLGSPLGWGNRVSGQYMGATLEVPIDTSDPLAPSAINRNLRFADNEAAIVPYVRARRFDLEVDDVDQGSAWELALGVAVRITWVSDLL